MLKKLEELKAQREQDRAGNERAEYMFRLEFSLCRADLVIRFNSDVEIDLRPFVMPFCDSFSTM